MKSVLLRKDTFRFYNPNPEAEAEDLKLQASLGYIGHPVPKNQSKGQCSVSAGNSACHQPDDVSLIPGTQVAEGESGLPKLSVTNHREQCLGMERCTHSPRKRSVSRQP